MAAQGAQPGPRPHRGGLQRRRAGARGVRPPGRAGLARLRRVPRPRTRPRGPGGGADDGPRRERRPRAPWGARRAARRADRTARRRAPRRRRTAPHGAADRGPVEGRPGRPLRPVRAAGAGRDRGARGVRRRGPLLRAVPRRRRRPRLRREVGGVLPGRGVPGAGHRARRHRPAAVLRPAPSRRSRPRWRPAWPPRRSRRGSRWPRWCWSSGRPAAAVSSRRAARPVRSRTGSGPPGSAAARRTPA